METAVNGFTGWGTVTGWVVAVIGSLLVYFATRRKTDVDESALILGKWKELVDTHEASIKRLTEEFDRDRQRVAEEAKRDRERYTEEIDRLVKRISELETQNREKDRKIKDLEDEVVGLKRSIAQNSKSAAFQLARNRGSNSDAFPEGVKE